MAGEDDGKRRLAQRGIALVDAADPDAIRARLRGKATDAAHDAVLRGLETISRITGHDVDAATAAAPAAASQQDMSEALQSLTDHQAAAFDARLRAATTAAASKQQQRADLVRDLADARQSFPDGSKQFAALIFACLQLLDDLDDHAAGRADLAAADVRRREELLLRVSALLSSRAGDALQGFVDHVVSTSRRAILK